MVNDVPGFANETDNAEYFNIIGTEIVCEPLFTAIAAAATPLFNVSVLEVPESVYAIPLSKIKPLAVLLPFKLTVPPAAAVPNFAVSPTLLGATPPIQLPPVVHTPVPVALFHSRVVASPMVN